MANSPTIVLGSLNDKELTAAIDRLVQHVETQSKKMADTFDSQINRMKTSLNGLGNVNINLGGTTNKSGTERVKKQLDETTQAAKTASTAIDQVAQSMEKTGSRKKGIEYLSLTSDVDKDVTYLINLNKDVDAQMASIIQKEQVLLEKKQEELRLSQQISQEQQRAQNSVGAKDLGINPNISAGRERQLNTTIAMEQHVSNLRSQLASLLEVEERDVKMVNSQKASYNELTVYIKHLQAAYQRLGGDIAKGEGKDIAAEFQKATRAAQQLQNQLNRPVDLKSAMGLSEKTLDDIAYKLRMLSNYRSGLDYSTQRGEIAMVNAEYNKLQKRMNDVIGRNEQLIKTNNALTRSFNYMKNRLAFYFTVGASTQFFKQLIEVRSQYEMNERALGILIDSAERGTKIFNELSQMALISPYTLIELSSAAKQLTAYDVAAKDVVDTTRRLADMASAVGIPIERLTYALGQIKAYGYLNARDARMFANAGIPLIKQLADYYTELEGHLVSTADIYDRIKKKSIGYEEVIQVMTKMTDEGGKFYDFQAKMAETLKVRLANLTLAWNNMLNDIGQTQQGLLTGSLNVLKDVFVHWRDIENVIYGVVTAFGAYKAYQLIITSLMGTTARAIDMQVLAQKRNEATMLRKQALVRQLTYEERRLIASQNMLTSSDYANVLSGKQLTKQKALLLVALNANNVQLKAAIANMGILTAEEMANINVGKALAIVFKSIGISIASLVKSIGAFLVSNWWLIAIAGLYELGNAYYSYTKHIEELNKTAAEHAKDAWKNVKDYMESDVSVNLRQRVTASPDSLDDVEAQKAWDDMREKIELSSQAANTFIAKLMQIPSVNERIKAGFGYLEDLEKVAGIMQSMPEDAIQISSTTLGGLFGEGLKDDLDDFIESYKEYLSLTKSQKESAYGESVFNEQKSDLEELRSEIKITTDSIYDFAAGQKFNSNQQREFFERMISETAQKEQMNAEQTRIYRMKAEEEYYQYASSKLKEQLQYQQGAQKAATEQRIIELNAEFGAQRAMQQSFFEWVSERHASEVRKQFQNMTKEEISHIDWSQPKWKQWAEKLAKDFSDEYGVSFNDLHRLVLQANTWSVHIPVYFQTIGQPLSDVQKDYEARTGKKFKDNYLIKDAKTQVEIIDILKKKQKEQAEAIETARKAGGKYWEENKKSMEDENNALIADIHAYNALTDAEEKALKKGGSKGNKKDLVLEALKQEIQLVEKLQGDYDKLAKSGASQSDALATIRGAYGNTIKKLNTELGGYGLPTIDITRLIVGKDPNKSLEHFKNTLSSLIDKGMLTLERSKEVEAVIEKLTLSAKTYNLDMITKGLNNELGRLKEEYELAVELDANPELGGMFADMMGLNIETLPRTIEEYAKQYTERLNKYLRDTKSGIELPSLNLTNDDLRAFEEMVEQDKLSQAVYENIKKGVLAVRDLKKKDISETTKEWNSLIDKYGKLEAKILKITKDTSKERLNVINKFGTDEQKKNARNLVNMLSISEDPSEVSRLQTELTNLLKDVVAKNPKAVDVSGAIANEQSSLTSKAYWEDFKNSELYTMTFEDMSRNSTRAIQLIIDKLEQLKGKVKEDPASMKALSKSLQDARKELESRSSTTTLVEASKEMKAATEEVTSAKKRLAEANREMSDAEQELGSSTEGTKAYANAVERLRIARERQEEAELNAAKAGNKLKAAQEKTRAGLETLSNELNNVQNLFKVVADLFADAGDDDTAEAINAISQGFAVMTTVIMGVVAAMVLLETTQPYLLAIAAALSVVVGLVSFLSGNSNKKITEQVEKSERAVKRLEIAYKDLEDAATHAYGAITMGVNRVTLANKELQLVELKRQIQLEKSRDSKYRDQDKILELEGQYKDLVLEIKNGVEDIVTEMLGISSAGDAATQLVEAMIDAFREGEDAMKAFSDKWDEMIDNMILKLIISQYMQKAWDNVMKTLNKKEEEFLAKSSSDKAEAQYLLEKYSSSFGEWLFDNGLAGYSFANDETKKTIEKNYQDYLNTLRDRINAADAANEHASEEYLKWSLDYMMGEGRDYMEGVAENLIEGLGEWYKFGDKAETSLSALQAGIQGITEDTAGALEAITNGMYQQVTLQSDILQQINTTLQNFDMDIQVATLGQILLQLQASYQATMAMRTMMENWTVAAGNGIRVELMS